MAEVYGTRKQIRIGAHKAYDAGVIISKTGVVADSNGEYWVKAGTPLYGTSLDTETGRQTAVTVSAGESGSGKVCLGLLLDDVQIKNGETQGNGTLFYDGTVDIAKIDSTTRALITTAVKTALKNITFVWGKRS